MDKKNTAAARALYLDVCKESENENTCNPIPSPSWSWSRASVPGRGDSVDRGQGFWDLSQRGVPVSFKKPVGRKVLSKKQQPRENEWTCGAALKALRYLYSLC